MPLFFLCASAARLKSVPFPKTRRDPHRSPANGRVALDAEFVADGGGDGVGVTVHRLFAFGFDHDARQGFGAGVANDDAA